MKNVQSFPSLMSLSSHVVPYDNPLHCRFAQLQFDSRNALDVSWALPETHTRWDPLVIGWLISRSSIVTSTKTSSYPIYNPT